MQIDISKLSSRISSMTNTSNQSRFFRCRNPSWDPNLFSPSCFAGHLQAPDFWRPLLYPSLPTRKWSPNLKRTMSAIYLSLKDRTRVTQLFILFRNLKYRDFEHSNKLREMWTTDWQKEWPECCIRPPASPHCCSLRGLWHSRNVLFRHRHFCKAVFIEKTLWSFN